MEDDNTLAQALGMTLEQLQDARRAEEQMYRGVSSAAVIGGARANSSAGPHESESRNPNLKLPVYDSTSGTYAEAWQIAAESAPLPLIDERIVHKDCEVVDYDSNWITGYRNLNQIITPISASRRNAYMELVKTGWQLLPESETRELCELLFGEGFSFETRPLARWLRHPILLFQNENYPWLIQQLIGGPCGVIAVAQTHLISALLYQGSGDLLHSLDATSCTAMHLRQVLSQVLTNIIWQTSSDKGSATLTWLAPVDSTVISGQVSELNERSGQPVSGHTTRLDTLFKVYTRHFDSIAGLCQYIFDNLLVLFCGPRVSGCLNLVISCILTRTLTRIREEDADPICVTDSNALLADFGHCTQDMMNLLLVGKAVANAFDGERRVDDLILRGLTKRPVVGYLSEMEVLRYTVIGHYLKNPLLPAWIIGKASHFTSLISLTPMMYKLELNEWLGEVASLIWQEVDIDGMGLLDTQKFATQVAVPKLGIELGSKALLSNLLAECSRDNLVLLESFKIWLSKNYQECPLILRRLEQADAKFRLRKGHRSGQPIYLYLDGQVTNLSDAIDRGAPPRPTATWALTTHGEETVGELSEIVNTRLEQEQRLSKTDFFGRP